MTRLIDRPLTPAEYEELAWAYYKTLPLEHFMESIAHSTQRKIALESLDLLQLRRREVQVFSELLIQYRVKGEIRRVVPDNMVRLHDQPVMTKASFNIELEPVGPFWVLEWVSSSSEGKDYGEAFEKYEKDLRVPYCLLFHPDDMDLRLYRHTGSRYELVKPNERRRLAIPQLDLELAIHEEWVRFWHQGTLLELPAELQTQLDSWKAVAAEEAQRADAERKRAEAAEERAREADQARAAAEEELARLKARLEEIDKGNIQQE